MVGLLDTDSGDDMLFGDDFTVDDIIWTGPQPSLSELGAQVGVAHTYPLAELEQRLRKAVALGRRIHFLPPYRGETRLQLSGLLGIAPALLHDYKSVDLMFAVAEMREVKSPEEIEALERAFRIGYDMHTLAMRMCRPGVVERQIAGAIEGVAKSAGLGVSFPPSSRSTARRSTTSGPTACWKPGACSSATRAARGSTIIVRTTRALTPSAGVSRPSSAKSIRSSSKPTTTSPPSSTPG